MPEIKTDIPYEIFEADVRSEHEGHARLIAVAAVVTTLLAALTGFLQAGALRTHDTSDIRAERLGALSLYASAGNGDQAQVQIERFQLLEQAQREQATAQAFARFANPPQASTELEAARWGYVATNIERDTKEIAASQRVIRTCPASSSNVCATCPDTSVNGCARQPLPAISPGGWYSAEQDPNFPTRYRQNAQWWAYFLSAQRDDANERADAAEGRFVHLAAGLTMFAVAVFLLGYSLTPQGRRRRRLFACVATLFVVCAAGWTIYSLAQGIPALSIKSSRAYANGLIEYNDSDYAQADKELKLATSLNPKFANAWTELGQDRGYEGIRPQYVDNEETQINDIGALAASAYADQQAIDAGSQSPLVRFSLGANLLYIGLLRHDDRIVQRSRRYSADAFGRFLAQLRQHQHPGQYLLFSEFNTAEADLVDRSAAAAGEYRAAVRRLLEPAFQLTAGVEPTVATALTDLSLIAQTRPRLAGEANALSQEIVRMVSRDKNDGWYTTANGYYLPSGNDHPQFGGIQALPDPGHLQYVIGKARQFDPTNDTVSVQWEYRDPTNHNWEVLPDVSGAEAAGVSAAVAPGTNDTLTANAPGYPKGSYLSSNPSFLAETSPHTCLPSGQYRAVLYANGQVAGTSSPVTTSWGELQGTGFGAINVAFCKPSSWRGFSAGPDVDTFISPRGTSGAWAFEYPAGALNGLSPELVIGEVVDGLSSGNSPLSGAVRVGSSSPSYFMNFRDAREQLWMYPAGDGKAGVIWSAAGTSPDGERYVGVVYGSGPATKASIDNLETELYYRLLSYSQL